MNPTTSLYRPASDRVLAGVCSGLGRYFNLDAVIVRLAWVAFSLLGGSGVLLYLFAWLLIPDEQGQRAATPLVLLVLGFVLLPAVCFLIALPFRILF
jgi:phage shock protein C